MRALIASLVIGSFALTGCQTAATIATMSPQAGPTYGEAFNNQFTYANYAAATELLRRFLPPPTAILEPSFASNAPSDQQPAPIINSAPFIVATVVNIDQLEESSSFGRLVSEQIASRLVELGQNVVELKIRNSLFMKKDEGELLLTREIKEVANAHSTRAVVVGTYTVSSSLVFVNLKIVDPVSNQIKATYDYAHPKNAQVNSMLANDAVSQNVASGTFRQWQFDRDMRRVNPDYKR